MSFTLEGCLCVRRSADLMGHSCRGGSSRDFEFFAWSWLNEWYCLALSTEAGKPGLFNPFVLYNFS